MAQGALHVELLGVGLLFGMFPLIPTGLNRDSTAGYYNSFLGLLGLMDGGTTIPF